ncbi:hypothetical protein [Nisaea sp.]|uniref:hypothetical protein n=1 Tax=Nisaea sp. TaxID=2024842 RepID=UPI00329A2CE1
MSAICYKPKSFREPSLAIIGAATNIIEEYQAEGFTLTLRQLYYQFVARGWIANKQSEYDRLGKIISDARMAGYIDWEAIEDRTRFLRSNPHWSSTQHILRTVSEQYAIDKWKGQDARVEVWIEKDALVGVIENVCRTEDVPFFACRGYSSQSELWRASQRIYDHVIEEQRVVVIHLGDHDPSGIDMTRDIEDRLRTFLDWHGAYVGRGEDVEVRRIALNMSQVEEFSPPPNPAKLTDSRVDGYLRKFGSSSWELDALDPRHIERLILNEIEDLRDPDLWAVAQEEEQSDKKRLGELASQEESP